MSNILHYSEGGGTLVATVNGRIYPLGQGIVGKETLATGTDMKTVLESIEKEGAALRGYLDPKVFQDIIKLGGSEAHANQLQNAADYAKKFITETATLEAKLGKLVSNPLARKLLTTEELKAANIVDVKLLDEFIADREALVKAIKAGGDNKSAIEGILSKHHSTAPKEVYDALKDTKVEGVDNKLGSIAAEMETAIINGKDSLKDLTTKFKSADETLNEAKIARNKANVTGEALKPFDEAVEKAAAKHKDLSESITKLGKDNPHIKASKELLKKEAPELHKLLDENKFLGSSLGAAASNISWGWTNKVAPKAEGVIGALWKNRGISGRAGIIAGTGALVYSAYAAFGNKGPGENAEKVRNNQQNEPAAGRTA
ncbi:MAG: hypothetical protein ACOYNL_10065 [Rickettsiales bacterium]